MKSKSLILGILGISVIGILIYFFKEQLKSFFLKNSKQDDPIAPQPQDQEIKYVYVPGGKNEETKAPVADYWSLDHNKVLKKGSKGPEVTQLQTLMNKALVIAKKPTIQVDGSFGPTTEKVLYTLASVKSITLNQAVNIFITKLTSGQ